MRRVARAIAARRRRLRRRGPSRPGRGLRASISAARSSTCCTATPITTTTSPSGTIRSSTPSSPTPGAMYDELLDASAAPRRDDFPSPVRHSAAAGVRRPVDRAAPRRFLPAASSSSRRACSISPRSIAVCRPRVLDVHGRSPAPAPTKPPLKRQWEFNPRVHGSGACRPRRCSIAICRAGRLRAADALRGISCRAGRSHGRRARAGRQRHRQRRARGRREGAVRASARVPGDSRPASPTRSVGLDRDRRRLEAMSAAARQTSWIASTSAIASPTIRRFTARWQELYRPVAGARTCSTAAAWISRGSRTRWCAWSAPRCERRDDARLPAARWSAFSSPRITASSTSPRRSRACWRRR